MTPRLPNSSRLATRIESEAGREAMHGSSGFESSSLTNPKEFRNIFVLKLKNIEISSV